MTRCARSWRRRRRAALGAIRLAWWREALDRLDVAPPPAEPRLQAVARELLPRGIRGQDLAGLEDGWAAMLDSAPWEAAAIAARGRRLFAIGARLLGASDEELGDAGTVVALASAVRGCGDRDEAERLIDEARRVPRHRFARRLRPLTALAALARRDLERWPSRRGGGDAGPRGGAAVPSAERFGLIRLNYVRCGCSLPAPDR